MIQDHHCCLLLMLIYLTGQEEGTVDFDDGIKITPFNMNEEMEEGHFDKDGMYIFDKKGVNLS